MKNDFSNELTKKELFNIIEQLDQWSIHYISVISGGEPFIREDIWDFLEYCVYKNTRIVVLCTNGTLLSDLNRSKFQILSDSTIKLSFSLDSVNPDIHNSFRGRPGTYDRLIEGIKNINSLKKDIKSKLILSISSVITKNNYNVVRDIFPFAKKMSIDYINFQPVNCMANFYGVPTAPEKGKFLFTNQEEIIKLKGYIIEGIKIAKKLGIKNNLSIFLKWAIPYFEYAIDQNKRKGYFFKELYKNFKCFVPFSHLKINSQGYILPCYLLPAVNNIRNTDIKTAWRNDIKAVREHLKSGRFFPQCKTCYCDFPYSLLYNWTFYPFRGRLFFMNLLFYYLKRMPSLFKKD